jgi:hypothetical protein
VSPRVSRTLSAIQPILLTPRRDAFDDPPGSLSRSTTAIAGCCTSRGKAVISDPSGGTSSSGSRSFATGCGKSCRSKRRSWTARSLWIDGKDPRGLPLTRRKRALSSLIPATTTVVS